LKVSDIQSQYVMCPAIPCYLHILEFCMFLEEQSVEKSDDAKKEFIKDVKVLRGPNPNQYLIAIKLHSTKAVANFLNLMHMQKFNPIEEEVCKVYLLDSARIFGDKLDYQSPEVIFNHQTEEVINCPICLEPVKTRGPIKPFTIYASEQKNRNDFNVTLLCDHTFH